MPAGQRRSSVVLARGSALRGSGALESSHTPGEGLHDREADLRVLLQCPEKLTARQRLAPHGARRRDRRRPWAAVDQGHLAEEIARPQNARLAQHARPTLAHEIERLAVVPGLNHDLPWRVVDHLRMLCEGAKLTLA